MKKYKEAIKVIKQEIAERIKQEERTTILTFLNQVLQGLNRDIKTLKEERAQKSTIDIYFGKKELILDIINAVEEGKYL